MTLANDGSTVGSLKPLEEKPMIKRLTALVALFAFFFGSTVAFADCGGCPKPDDKDKVEATLPR